MNQSPDHIAMATNLALLTETPEDIAEAERLVLLGLAVKEYGPSINMFYWYQVAKMRLLNQDFDGAFEGYQKAYGITEENPLMEMQGRDTAALTLSATELYLNRDLDRSEQRVDFILNEWTDTKGASRHLATAHKLKAQHLIRRGALETVGDHIEKALANQERFSGVATPSYLDILMMQAEHHAMMGDHDKADAVLKASPSDTNRFKLAAAFLLNEKDGAAAARAYLKNSRFERRKNGAIPVANLLV